MPWYILRDTVDSSPIDGINKPRSMCAPDAESALLSVTVQGVKAELADVAPSTADKALKYISRRLTFKQASV